MGKRKTPNERLLAYRLSIVDDNGRPLSQSELARRLDCHPSFINQTELGLKKFGLKTALALQAETRDWSEGPIDASEWL